MHILILILGAIVTILVLLNRLAASGALKPLEWLDPVKWKRRKAWREKLAKRPGDLVEGPREVSAGLLYVAAKCSGELTREARDQLLIIFEREFEMDNDGAVDLLSTCQHIIRDPAEIAEDVPRYLKASLPQFSLEDRLLTMELVESVVRADARPTERQLRFLDDVRRAMRP